ncbi:MAG: 50S ribosomal protein L25/general stress protein Ctc [Bacteroidetes bacterium]|nr:50S ribosomal protein L25/general stress protein Ctc [Bacteroidota bacterium]
MKTVSISGSPRENVGKKDAKLTRRTGKIPCVLYGGKDQVHFTADVKAFKSLIYTPEVHIAKISVSGNEYEAVMREVQYHPTTDEILHVDFMQLFAEKEIKLDIPVNLIGVAEGVRAGGKLIKKQRLLKVRAIPANLPDSIQVNIEKLAVGGIIRAKEITVANVVILNDPQTVIATVKGKRGMAAAEGAEAAAPAKKK